MKYFEEAKFIWKTYVPKDGQADTVQGELLRAIEKLRYEAQNNGNANWDRGFKHFCDYIWDILSKFNKFEKSTLKDIKKDLKRLSKHKKPYLENDLYDRLTDHVVEWYFDHKEPIKHEKNPKLHR